MRVLAWHVHGSWMTSFVQGRHEYLVPLLPDRGPDGRGRARTFPWPERVHEVCPEELADRPVDVVVLQRPHELDLLRQWTGLTAGVDLPALYVEHNTPRGDVDGWRHPLADSDRIPVVLMSGRPRRLIGFAEPTTDTDGPAWDESEHEVLRWCRLIESVGGECTIDDLRLVLDHAHDGPWDGPVVVHPGASRSARQWPVDRFAEVVSALGRRGHVCMVTGSRDETALTAGVIDRAGVESAVDAGGRCDLPQLARLIRRAPLLICGDTGPAHLATAVGTPSVLLFGPTSPARWGPLIDRDRHRVLWQAMVGHQGDPHGDTCDPALLAIRVEDVLVEAEALLVGR